MWNLIKNVFRSLKRNKASVVGLTFLVFLSIGIFTVLNSVSSNISKEYSRITTSGNIHDFTISENYVIGNVKYDFVNNPEDSTYMGWSNDNTTDTPDIPWPIQTGSGTAWERTYQVSLNADSQIGSLLKTFYDNHGSNPNDPYYSLLHPLITINNSKELEYINHTPTPPNPRHSTDSKSAIDTQLGAGEEGTGDLNLLTAAEASKEAELINVVTQTDTPMQEYLDQEMKDKVSWRNFKSLDISNSPDGKLYKIVQSNPEDKIDKVILFGDNQQDNFSTTEFNPLVDTGIDLKQLFPDTNDPIGACLSYNDQLPTKFSEWDKFKGSQAQAFFALLSRGDDVYNLNTTRPELYNDIQNLSSDNPAESYYTNYVTSYKESGFLLQNKGYRYSINWSPGEPINPQSWTLTDWTSRYAVVSPAYLEHNGFSAYNIKDRGSFIRQLNEGYANNINGTYTNDNWDQFLKDHPKNVVMNSDGISLPFVVIGSGITADFTYPILNLQHSTPNPDKESVIFGNTNAYKRVFDSYRGNQTENYLVGTFNKDVNHSQTLNEMNQTAQDKMSWPKNIKACYMADDTNNVLNASAFRIAFIPSLVSKIQLIQIALTSAVIILSLFICIIVIHRYIGNTRSQIGVMQANGINKRKITVSLIPFALLPAIAGGFGGYLVGFFLQSPAVSLFGNYWMLPTPIASFNIWVLLISILLPFFIFLVTSILTTLVLLREKTVNLMKSGSEFKGSFIARHIKEPFRSFGIMTKFRISTAFNSIWKLVILSVMVSLSISTLIFGINMVGKFRYAQEKTFASRNYSYAVDLYTPTSQGGQYVPVNADVMGQSGFIQSSEGTNWMPNLYFDQVLEKNPQPDMPIDMSYNYIFGNDGTDEAYEYHGIPKSYYIETYAMYDTLSDGTSGDIERSFINTDKNTGNNDIAHGTNFYPLMGDAGGETNDVMFLKNRSMFKTGLDFTVGALGMTSNPWSVAVSLMPENNKNLADGRTTNIIQMLGEAVMWGNGDIANPNNPYKDYYEHDGEFKKARDGEFFKPDKQLTSGNDSDPPNYSLDKDKCISKGSILGFSFPIGNLEPTFTHFLNYVYTNTNFMSVDQNTAEDNDYQVSYNKIPLKNDDETYTYLDATKTDESSSVRILGLKNNSQYLNLTNAGGYQINNLIDDKHTQQDLTKGYNPIIVNAYAQHKYNLKVGDTIRFTINNKANRVESQINNTNDNPSIPFKVVGVNTSYQGEEYFTNQQLANQLLGLRSEFSNTYDLHNYYFNSKKQDGMLDDWPTQPIYTEENKDQLPPNTFYDLMDLSNLTPDSRGNNFWNPASDYISKEGVDPEHAAHITPYGFNGVFTKRTNGSSILNGGQYLYAPSGIYPGNDALDSDVVTNILKQSANLEVANIVSGIINTEIGQKINEAFKTWQGTKNEANFKAMVDNDIINQFTSKLKEIYGSTSVVALVNGASDRDSTHLIFTNLSNTITQVEVVALAIVGLMVILIVMLITVMLIGDSKRLAAILKALGYSDNENSQSFLAIYIPVIAIGLLLSIPLSFAIIYTFQAVIFSAASILLTASVKWWSFIVGTCAILAVFTASGFWGYYSLRRDRLIDMMKE